MSRASVNDKGRVSATRTHTHDTAFDGTESKLALTFTLVALEVFLASVWAGRSLGLSFHAFPVGAALT